MKFYPYFAYARTKLMYSASLSAKKRLAGEIAANDAWPTCWRNFLKGKMTSLHRNEGQEMAPTIPGKYETLLIRNLACPDTETADCFTLLLLYYCYFYQDEWWNFLLCNCFDNNPFMFRLNFEQVAVGDVVLLKNPLDSNKLIVRRLAALGGQEMISSDEKDEPFVIDHDECWVLSDNKELKAQEAKDSRTFGSVSIMDIMGRVIYRFQSMQDHGPIFNSHSNSKSDWAVVQFELELSEMQKISET